MTTAWNLLLCDVAVQDVRYSYSSRSSGRIDSEGVSFRTLSSEDSSLAMAQLLASVTNIMYIPRNIPAVIEGIGLQSGVYADAYALELSREWMAFASWFYEPAPVLKIQGSRSVLGSSIQLLPLALYIATTTVFW